jgi:hypothetical protein
MWPYHLFHFQEEQALHFLHLKGYNIELALATVTYNQDQLIHMLSGKEFGFTALVERRRKRAQSFMTN